MIVISVKETGDFFGLNHYSSSYFFPREHDITDVSYEADQDVGSKNDPKWLGLVSKPILCMYWHM